MSTKTAFHTQQPSYFDNVASIIAVEVGVAHANTLEPHWQHRYIWAKEKLRVNSFDDTWATYLAPDFPRSSPRHTGKGPGLLDLPTELRLEVYRLLLDDIPLGFGSLDSIDVVNFRDWHKAACFEHFRRKTYSWILAHPMIFREAIDLVLRTHPIMICSLRDISECKDSLQSASRITLDLEGFDRRMLKEAAHRLSFLPHLRSLTFQVSHYHDEHKADYVFRVLEPNHRLSCDVVTRTRRPKQEAEETRMQNEIDWQQTADRLEAAELQRQLDSRSRIEQPSWMDTFEMRLLRLELAHMELKLEMSRMLHRPFFFE